MEGKTPFQEHTHLSCDSTCYKAIGSEVPGVPNISSQKSQHHVKFLNFGLENACTRRKYFGRSNKTCPWATCVRDPETHITRGGAGALAQRSTVHDVVPCASDVAHCAPGTRRCPLGQHHPHNQTAIVRLRETCLVLPDRGGQSRGGNLHFPESGPGCPSSGAARVASSLFCAGRSTPQPHLLRDRRQPKGRPDPMAPSSLRQVPAGVPAPHLPPCAVSAQTPPVTE